MPKPWIGIRGGAESPGYIGLEAPAERREAARVDKDVGEDFLGGKR